MMIKLQKKTKGHKKNKQREKVVTIAPYCLKFLKEGFM
jgi:hypothetical protein